MKAYIRAGRRRRQKIRLTPQGVYLKAMKVTFIYPRFEKFLSGLPELDAGLVDYFLGNFTTPPSLGITRSWPP